jgi:hypothetical protein
MSLIVCGRPDGTGVKTALEREPFGVESAE